MSNYKSKHTGEQIDMAVERVISKNFPFDVVNSLDDIIELDKLEVGYQVYVRETNKLYKYTTLGLEEIPIFTSFDKNKLDKLNVIGIQNIRPASLPETVSSAANRNYAVELDSRSGNAFVNIPWEKYTLPKASQSELGGVKVGSNLNIDANGVLSATDTTYNQATQTAQGLMSSDDKKRLDGINVYKHAFTALSALPDSGDGWYSIINLGDMESAIVQISAGQSDTQVAVSAGWGGNDIGSLTVLNCTLDVNNNYAHIKAVRIRRHKKNSNDANGYLMLEAKLNRTGYTNGYRNTVVSVFTNAGHNPIVIDSNATNVLQLNSSTSETLLQEFELEDRTIMVKAINVETINADNLANVATTGNYNDLNNKPTIPAAQVNSDWNAASGKAQILNKPTIPTNLSDLSSDTTHRTVTDTEKQTWNNKSNFSGSYNDLTNKPSIPSAVTEAIVTDWGFTKNTGTYSKPSTGIPKSDLHTDVQNALNKATTALQTHQDISGKQDVISDLETIRQGAAKGATALQSYEEQYKGTVTGVTINGETKTPTNGIVNIGTVITNHQDISGKQDTLVSGVNIKTINGESIIGSGNVDLSNYATIEHVNTQIGNINSILTSIINQ